LLSKLLGRWALKCADLVPAWIDHSSGSRGLDTGGSWVGSNAYYSQHSRGLVRETDVVIKPEDQRGNNCTKVSIDTFV
jgi:hypothetical protein